MVMELEYDRSLYGQEHEAGPFHVTDEQIVAFSEGIGETNPVHTDVAAARAKGFKGLIAPPTFPTVLVRGVSLPDIKLKFGRTTMHAGQRVQSKAPIVSGDSLIASSHLKEVLPQDRAQRHDGVRRLGNHVQKPGRSGSSRRPGIIRFERVTLPRPGTAADAK